MALNFPYPASPGDTYSNGGIIYTYDGVKWIGNIPATYGDSNVKTLLTSGDVTGISVTGGITSEFFLGPLANGQSNVNIPDLDGNVEITVNGNVWSFNTNGNLAFPDNTEQHTAYPGHAVTLVSDNDPNVSNEGSVWYNSDLGRSFVKYNGQWVDMNPQQPINPDLQVDSITFPDGSVQTKSSDLGNLAVGDFATLYDTNSQNNLNLNEGNLGDVSLRSFRNDVKITSDYINTSSTWQFRGDGNLVLPNGGAVGGVQAPDGVDLYANPTQRWVQLNYDNQSFVWAEEQIAGIQAGENAWIFVNDGRILFPDGTIQETAYPGETTAKVPVTDYPPSAEEGTVWFNTELGRAFVKYNGQWVDFSPQIVPPDAANPFDQDLNTTDNVTFNNINASNIQINDLDTTVLAAGSANITSANIENLTIGNNLSINNISTGNLTANYFIGDGRYLTNLSIPDIDKTVLLSDNPPPLAAEGSVWFNTQQGRTFVKYQNQWVDSSPQTVDARTLRIDEDDYVATPNNRIVTDIVNASMVSVDSVVFPDDTVQTTAFQPATLLDGGGANSTYTGNIPPGGIPNPFNQELNTTDHVQFNSVTAGNFVGNLVGNVSVANVTGLGNIATINLTGSSSTVLYGNGVFAPATSTFSNTTTDNFFIDNENKGLVVDAAGLKRFGFMKYSGIEGSLVHSTYTGAAVPLRIGRTNLANVTDATVNEFTTEIYIGTNGCVRIGDDTVNNINDPTNRLEVNGNIKTSTSVIFSDNTSQTTAYRPTTAPTTSKGSAGNKAGMVAFTNGYFYYCISDYTDGVADIWVRSAWDQTSWS